tara:strand:- start:9709 stop:10392 length:684 start_codon:yes stop_codon:yes gene_type:complete
MTIKNIKIYGERNSGTNFLEKLISTNTDNVNVIHHGIGHYKSRRVKGWKHGVPDITLYSQSDIENTLVVFIIRDLEPWLKSMFLSPYEYSVPNSFEQFLQDNINVHKHRLDHPVVKFDYESKNIFDLRYFKINRYLDFYKNIHNGIFINLEHVQRDNHTFLQILNQHYNIDVKHNIVKIDKHTKTNKKGVLNQNTQHIQIPLNILQSKVNNNLEHFVNNLKHNFLYK